MTAAHVVSAQNAQHLVFTVNTEMQTDDIPGVDYSVLSEKTYESMYTAETLFVSNRDDLAVIRFSADEELAVIAFAASDPAKGDRILCVGNPENDWFAVSYGKVTSGVETFGEGQGFPSHAMRHSAYIHVGSSGGAAIGETNGTCGHHARRVPFAQRQDVSLRRAHPRQRDQAVSGRVEREPFKCVAPHLPQCTSTKQTEGESNVIYERSACKLYRSDDGRANL